MMSLRASGPLYCSLLYAVILILSVSCSGDDQNPTNEAVLSSHESVGSLLEDSLFHWHITLHEPTIQQRSWIENQGGYDSSLVAKFCAERIGLTKWSDSTLPSLLTEVDCTQRKLLALAWLRHYDQSGLVQKLDSLLRAFRTQPELQEICGESDLDLYATISLSQEIATISTGDFKEARAEAGLEYSGSFIPQKWSHSFLDYRQSYYLALEKYRAGKSDEAMVILDDLLEKYGKHRKQLYEITRFQISTAVDLSDSIRNSLTPVLMNRLLTCSGSRRDSALVLFDRAWFHFERQEYYEALPIFYGSIDLMKDQDMNLYIAASERGMGFSYQALDDHVNAITHFRECIAIVQDIQSEQVYSLQPQQLLVPVILHTWGVMTDNYTSLYEETANVGALDTAQYLYDQVAASLSLTHKYLDTDSRMNLMAIYEEISGFALRLLAINGKEPDLDLIYNYIESAKSNLQISRSHQHDCSQLDVPQRICSRERELINAVEVTRSHSPASLRAQQSLDSLREVIRTDYPKYFMLRYGHRKTHIEDVQKIARHNDAVIVQYRWFTEPRADVKLLVRMTIGPDTVFHSWLDVHQIGSTLRSYEDAFRQNDWESWTSLGHQLYDDLLDECIASSSAKELIIIPDGALAKLSFGSLVDSISQTDYRSTGTIVEKYPISYAYSGKSLLNNYQREKSKSDNYLGMAYSGQKNSHHTGRQNQIDLLPEIIGSNDEILNSKIAYESNSSGSAKIFIGQQCRKSQFLQYAEEASIIHLATHGDFEHENAHLQFRGDSTERLELAELERLDLSGSIVILSACKTGSGTKRGAEGAYSVANSFNLAGARTVVASLWDLPDVSARIILPEFVSAISTGDPPAVALRKAQLYYLRTQKDPVLKSPLYWAGLQVIGAG